MLSERIYWKLRPWLTPGLQNSHAVYAQALEAELPRTRRWLDLGCGHCFVAEWLTVDVSREQCMVVGIDLDLHALQRHEGLSHRLIANGEQLPFRADSFDLVTMNMVLEHVEQPQLLLAEVSRILHPRGAFIVHTPNVRGYTTALTRMIPQRLRAPLATVLQGRNEEDVYPTFYRANTDDRLRVLAAGAGLRLETLALVNSSPLFVNFAPLLIPEMLFIRAINALGLEQLRACLIARFEKTAQ